MTTTKTEELTSLRDTLLKQAARQDILSNNAQVAHESARLMREAAAALTQRPAAQSEAQALAHNMMLWREDAVHNGNEYVPVHVRTLEKVIAQLRDMPAHQQATPVETEPVGDVRCEGCGYMTHHREHMGCVRAAKQNTHTHAAQGVDERVAFERWYVEHCPDITCEPIGSRLFTLQWEAWQARASLPTQPAAQAMPDDGFEIISYQVNDICFSPEAAEAASKQQTRYAEVRRVDENTVDIGRMWSFAQATPEPSRRFTSDIESPTVQAALSAKFGASPTQQAAGGPVVLPSFDECNAKKEAGLKLNPLERFVLENDPADPEESAGFSLRLLQAIDFVVATHPAPAVPDVLFDGFAVLKALTPQAERRTSAENVSDVLDAVVRLIRAAQAKGGEHA